MTEDEIRTAVLAALTSVAPDLEGEAVDPATAFRDQFDFDSMDLLNFAIALHDSLGVDIPEIDYPRVASLKGSIAYLSEKLSASGRS
ncbi:phosphopantetheine-binding protein [Thalassobaculum sp.]|uniref:acyl carrier protein n=1 Tax=Thalassobaculum sp. TaxID=2022740 RepID=UPI0032EFC566